MPARGDRGVPGVSTGLGTSQGAPPPCSTLCPLIPHCSTPTPIPACLLHPSSSSSPLPVPSITARPASAPPSPPCVHTSQQGHPLCHTLRVTSWPPARPGRTWPASCFLLSRNGGLDPATLPAPSPPSTPVWGCPVWHWVLPCGCWCQCHPRRPRENNRVTRPCTKGAGSTRRRCTKGLCTSTAAVLGCIHGTPPAPQPGLAGTAPAWHPPVPRNGATSGARSPPQPGYLPWLAACTCSIRWAAASATVSIRHSRHPMGCGSGIRHSRHPWELTSALADIRLLWHLPRATSDTSGICWLQHPPQVWGPGRGAPLGAGRGSAWEAPPGSASWPVARSSPSRVALCREEGLPAANIWTASARTATVTHAGSGTAVTWGSGGCWRHWGQ